MTYTIPRYPVHLIDFVSAANGRRVTIRPMLPQDFKLQREFFRSLSARARYYRFMASFNELPDGVAERLGKIDYSSHLALLAEVFEGRSETMVGEARVPAIPPPFPPARGIGRALLTQLEREAAASGIRRMLADTLYDNKAMRGLATSSGYAVRANREDGRLVKLDKQLSASMAPPNVQQSAA